MSNGMALPKDLSLGLVFVRMSFHFTHRVFDESMQGHLGYISQFILKELYSGTSIADIREAFPFSIQPVIERLEQSLLMKENDLTEIGRHYGACLAHIQDQPFHGWLHWGKNLKILLHDDFRGFADEIPSEDSTLHIKPDFKGSRPFATFDRQDKIEDLISFFCPEYDNMAPQFKKTDIWTVHARPVRTSDSAQDRSCCLISIPAGTPCDDSGLTVFLPAMEGLWTFNPVDPWDAYFPFVLPGRRVMDKRICLLTGMHIDSGEELKTFESCPVTAWPKDGWIHELSGDAFDDPPTGVLMEKKIQVSLKWRVLKLGPARMMASFCHAFPGVGIWTQDIVINPAR